MAAPPGGVLTDAIAPHLRPIQYLLDPTAKSARRFRLCRPDRFEDFDNQTGIDRLDRQLANDRFGVRGEGRAPLRCVFGVAPAGLVTRDVFGRGPLESGGLSGLERGLLAGRLSGLNRV